MEGPPHPQMAGPLGARSTENWRHLFLLGPLGSGPAERRPSAHPGLVKPGLFPDPAAVTELPVPTTPRLVTAPPAG